jgi:hypothetical protein
MIARPTLAALASILTEEEEVHVHHHVTAEHEVGPSLQVRLAELPELQEVGGIARVDRENGQPVGIARVGRNSYAAYRPTEGDESSEVTPSKVNLRAVARELGLGGLVELAVHYNETEGVLTVLGDKR